jgi:hypothetical protein
MPGPLLGLMVPSIIAKWFLTRSQSMTALDMAKTDNRGAALPSTFDGRLNHLPYAITRSALPSSANEDSADAKWYKPRTTMNLVSITFNPNS